ncbi:MAG: ISAs1 family transposase [Gammaproteobacteria bacterium]|nr:ISAs1 family transposase [Gammaproteobacteria bacterium]
MNVRGEKKFTQESRYHISSLQAPKPETALQAVRDHWGIENTLHWILDMSFNEDYSRIHKENTPQIMAIIRHIALNLLQQAKLQMKRQSIKGIRKICSWDNHVLTQIISKHRCQVNSS